MLIFSLDTKKCMNSLLLSSVFDSFLFIEGEVTTFNTFQIDGRLKKEFYRQDEEAFASIGERTYSYWKELREFVFSLIRGKRTPLGFKLVFSLSKSNIERFIDKEELPYSASDIQGLYLNFKYNGTELSCTTGTSMNTFTMDKSADQAWDKMVQKFFAKHEIKFDVL